MASQQRPGLRLPWLLLSLDVLPNATETSSFTGSYIAYYTDFNTDHGSFNISIDDSIAFELSSYSPNLVEKQMLYSAGLSYGTHTLTVRNNEANKAMGVDHFVYRPFEISTSTSTSPTASATVATTPELAWSSVSPTLDPVTSLGIAFGVLASVVLLILCVAAIRRRSRGKCSGCQGRAYPGAKESVGGSPPSDQSTLVRTLRQFELTTLGDFVYKIDGEHCILAEQ